MCTLPGATPAPARTGAVWSNCAACDVLFPATPPQTRCRTCLAGSTRPTRCQAAHPEDHSPCEGPTDAVRLLDRDGEHLYGCVRHASVVLASVAGVRVYPAAVPGAAIDAFERARLRRPFRFDPAAPGPALAPAAAGGGGW